MENEHKQEIQKLIDDVKMATNSSVALFTSNELIARSLEDWFPGIKIHLISKEYFPDSDELYILPEFKPLKEIKLHEEET